MVYKYALAILIVLAAVFAACGDDDDGGGDDATQSATTAAVSPTPASTAPSDDGQAQTFVSETFGVPVSITAPDAWTFGVDIADVFAIDHQSGADGPAGYIAFSVVDTVYAADGLTQEPAPADLVEFLTTHPRLVVQDTQQVTVGGLPATLIEAASNEGDSWKLFEASDGPFEVHYQDRIRFYVIQSPERQVLLAVGAEEPTRFAQFIPLAEPVIDTIEFGE